MKKLSVLLFILSIYSLQHLHAQPYQEKTIFQLLKIEDKRSPLNRPAADKNIGETGIIETKDFLEEKYTTLNSTELLTVVEAVGKWVKANPASTKPFSPQKMMDLQVKGPFYDSKIEYTGQGVRVVTDFGSKNEIGNTFYVPVGSYGFGFNILDKEKNSRYYDAEGKLIFDRKFSYVDKDNGNRYRFYVGKKCGIADSTGKILLSAEYDEVYSFDFNKKVWFSVQKGNDVYFLEYGNDKPVMKNEDGRAGNLPELIGDHYWLSNGRVYDMVKREELFTLIDKQIYSGSDHWPFFYIKRKSEKLRKLDEDEEEIYFDAAGKLLLGQPIHKRNGLSDSTTIMSLFVRDTVVRGERYPFYKSGIVHDKGYWLTEPIYDRLEEMDRTNVCRFLTRNGKPSGAGLMDAGGKVLIQPGRFRHFDAAGLENRFVCFNDSGSLIWNRKTGAFTKLPKSFLAFQYYGEMEKLGIMNAIMLNNKHYLVDTNYNLLDTTAWADVDLPSYKHDGFIGLYPLIDGKREYYEEKVFMNRRFERMSLNFNGQSYTTFMSIDSIGPDAYFYQFKKRPGIVQTKPGKYFTTDCERIEYDPYFNWYIAKNRNGVGLLDEDGKEIVPFIFDRIEPYSQYFGTAQLSTNQGFQQLDKNGKLLFDGKYNSVVRIHSGYFIVEKNGKKGVVNRNGKEIIPVNYPYLEILRENIWYGADKETNQFMAIGSLQGR